MKDEPILQRASKMCFMRRYENLAADPIPLIEGIEPPKEEFKDPRTVPIRDDYWTKEKKDV